MSAASVSASSLLNYNALGTAGEVRNSLVKTVEATCGEKKADTKATDAKCGEKKAKDAKCGEKKAKDAKCGEGKCGEKKTKDAKCGEGKCGEKKSDAKKTEAKPH